MDKNIEQRICLKFCIANGIPCAKSLKMLQKAYGESTLSKTRAYEWYRAFKSGRDVVENLPRSGRPSTSSTEVNIAKVKEMITENDSNKMNKLIVLEFHDTQRYELLGKVFYSLKKDKIYYDSNQSDAKGYTLKQRSQMQPIKMKGMHPSLLICSLYDYRNIFLSVWKTHNCHEEDLICRYLSTSDKGVTD